MSPGCKKSALLALFGDYRHAHWDGLTSDFAATDWSLLRTMTADAAASFLTSKILSNAGLRILPRILIDTKHSHPWMTQRCKDALRNKAAAEHSAGFSTTAQSCSAILAESYGSHMAQTRVELQHT